jgi:hypothetical protein
MRLRQPEGPGSCIYIPQEQGRPVIPQAFGLSNLFAYYCMIYLKS